MEDELDLRAEALDQGVHPDQAVLALVGVEADEPPLALTVGRVVAAEEVDAPGGVVVQVEARGLGMLRAVAVDQEGDALPLPAQGVVPAPQPLAPGRADLQLLAGPLPEPGRRGVPLLIVVRLVALLVQDGPQEPGAVPAEGVAVELRRKDHRGPQDGGGEQQALLHGSDQEGASCGQQGAEEDEDLEGQGPEFAHDVGPAHPLPGEMVGQDDA